MIVFPNCKINLGLHITRKRADGYHDLETVFYPVHSYRDALECVKPADTASADSVAFSCSGLPVAGSPDDNLCVKAWHLLKKDFPGLLPVQMHLHKEIPMGAGLGGGSADGAFALRLLNDVFRLNLTQQQLMAYALQLGSDCPFFILNKPCIATGRGEKMEEIELDLSSYTIVVSNMRIHVSTATAFSGITPKKPGHSLRDIVRLPVTEWKNVLANDFETTVGRKHPEIIIFKEMMYNAGALYASMTGSGSAVYGIFDRHIPLPSKWGYWEGRNPFPDDNSR
jgi:4-diphosphocytidyl-2-C-methyl-D-erythritol kinase